MEHHFARSLRMRIAAALVGGEDLLIAELQSASAGNLADGVETPVSKSIRVPTTSKVRILKLLSDMGASSLVLGLWLAMDVHAGALGTMIRVLRVEGHVEVAAKRRNAVDRLRGGSAGAGSAPCHPAARERCAGFRPGRRHR